ncbi:DUF1488 domain-containing protein [Vibrio barjaei]|jgi:hypothetical protein|uniref:DUF1488 domain-containing protein n=1 Tax=Vibrio barjaei TaxID=1676683 RepID=A0ABW7IEJ8_9VIBR|nr:DUF1488 domain-containing protein [Vibrio barjaei]MCG9790571.1 DUF1488 domain-containing protein [Vibrio mediterranei]MCY9872858.1 DUF1488 domain-containing protein [Vibrio barjaei]OIN23221.1 transcriptional regulator [Vibrio barjaei]
MNQSILFSDQATWDEATGMVEFHAHQSGMLIVCLVSLEKLAQLAYQKEVSKQEAISMFDSVRFDIEEIAEALIEDESFDEQGKIVIR